VSIEVRLRHGLKLGQTVVFDNAELTSDVAESEGGDGAGPSPHDLDDAALGACKALTVMWYAARKRIRLENIEIRVDRDARQERTGTYMLTTRPRLGGSLSDTQLQELRGVAEKCAVHKLMTTVTTIIRTHVERLV
jgi:putative redox protein